MFVLCCFCSFMLVLSFCKRMLPIAWNMKDSLFQGSDLWESIYTETKSCRTENNIYFFFFWGYRNIWPMRTAATTKDSNTKNLQQPTSPFPHLAFKSALLKHFEEFGVWGAPATCLLAWACNKSSSAPNSIVSVLFGLSVYQTHKNCSVTICFLNISE